MAVLLTLLHLNIQRIYLGPSLPAFITPNVLQAIVKKWNLRQVDPNQVDKQLGEMLAKV